MKVWDAKLNGSQLHEMRCTVCLAVLLICISKDIIREGHVYEKVER